MTLSQLKLLPQACNATACPYFDEGNEVFSIVILEILTLLPVIKHV